MQAVTFTLAGGSSANYIAMWDGSDWSSLGDGLNDSVYAIADNGTSLFVGGAFATAGTVNARHIANWDGSSWTAIGSGVNSVVHALCYDPAHYIVNVGGEFTEAGTFSALYLAQLDALPSGYVANLTTVDLVVSINGNVDSAEVNGEAMAQQASDNEEWTDFAATIPTEGESRCDS